MNFIKKKKKICNYILIVRSIKKINIFVLFLTYTPTIYIIINFLQKQNCNFQKL